MSALPMTPRALIVLGALTCVGCNSSGPTDDSSSAPPPVPKLPPSAPAAREPAAAELAKAQRASPIRSDEEVVVFPALGSWSTERRRWRLSVRLWIFEPEDDSWRRAAFTKALADELEVEGGEDETLKKRVAPFLADNEGGKVLTLRLGRLLTRLPPSGDDGHIVTQIDVPLEVMPPKGGAVDFEVVTREGDDRRFVGKAHFVTPTGRLVVSDVDDTVKVTEVREPKRMLRRTFLEPMELVPKIADGIGRLLEDGGHLHFVSASPYQLQPFLQRAFDRGGLPAATFDLKRWRPSHMDLDQLLADPMETKAATLEALAKRFPLRKWVLVGDSGEKDPEVYGAFARDHASIVERIFIRNVTGEKRSSPRFEKAFKAISDGTWELFTTGNELR